MPTKVVIRCHCGTFEQAVYLLADRLPALNYPCHCTICRSVTGCLSYADIQLDSSTKIENLITDMLCKIETSTHSCKYFCKECGTHMLECSVPPKSLEHNPDGSEKWFVPVGCIEMLLSSAGEPTSVERLSIQANESHSFIKSTLDGGTAPLFADDIAGNTVRLFMGKARQNQDPITLQELMVELKHKANSDVRASGVDELEMSCSCFCGGVKFSIRRPKIWTFQNSEKYEAELCACTSCRRSSGQQFTPWALRVPQDRIVVSSLATSETKVDITAHERSQASTTIEEPDKDSEIQWRGELFGQLKRYESSPDKLAERDFCSRCGACVFFHSTRKTGTVDIACGVMHARSGSMAYDWLSWDQSIHCKEDAVDTVLVERVNSNLSRLEDIAHALGYGSKT